MHQQATATNGVTQASDPCDHISEQRCTEALTLIALVNPKASKQSNRLGIATGSTAEALGQIGDSHAGHAPRVKGNNNRPIDLRYHKNARGSRSVSLSGHRNQPAGLLRRAATKTIQPVVGYQQDRWVKRSHACG